MGYACSCGKYILESKRIISIYICKVNCIGIVELMGFLVEDLEWTGCHKSIRLKVQNTYFIKVMTQIFDLTSYTNFFKSKF